MHYLLTNLSVVSILFLILSSCHHSSCQSDVDNAVEIEAEGQESNDKIKSKLAVEILTVGDCSQVAEENNFITLHFISKWDDGELISSTYERGVPVEIQLGTKMLSTGLDEGLMGTCLNEKRKITVPADVGLIDVNHAINDPRKVVYEIELLNISDRTTVNTFNYLDLDGDKRISALEAESLVKMFMKALSSDMGIDVKHLVSFFMSLHDKNGDNFISENEFLDSVTVNEKVLSAFGSKDEL